MGCVLWISFRIIRDLSRSVVPWYLRKDSEQSFLTLSLWEKMRYLLSCFCFISRSTSNWALFMITCRSSTRDGGYWPSLSHSWTLLLRNLVDDIKVVAVSELIEKSGVTEFLYLRERFAFALPFESTSSRFYWNFEATWVKSWIYVWTGVEVGVYLFWAETAYAKHLSLHSGPWTPFLQALLGRGIDECLDERLISDSFSSFCSNGDTFGCLSFFILTLEKWLLRAVVLEILPVLARVVSVFPLATRDFFWDWALV